MTPTHDKEWRALPSGQLVPYRLCIPRPSGSNQAEPGRPRNATKLDGTGRTDQTVRRARRPHQTHECGRARPRGALTAQQTGSGRIGAHEILRSGSQAKCPSYAPSSRTTQRCIQRTQARRTTRSSAIDTCTRHGGDSQRVTKRSRSSWFRCYKMLPVKRKLTHAVHGRPSNAPLLRSLLKKFGYTDTVVLHDNVSNGITLIGKP